MNNREFLAVPEGEGHKGVGGVLVVAYAFVVGTLTRLGLVLHLASNLKLNFVAYNKSSFNFEIFNFIFEVCYF